MCCRACLFIVASSFIYANTLKTKHPTQHDKDVDGADNGSAD